MLKTRFAPTPSGFLHIGNAFSFVQTWLLARKHGGSIHLRIDDIDAERTREVYVQDIFETIDWLGLDYDSGAQSVTDFYQHHSQQLRLAAYDSVLQEMRAHGLLFGCTCSRTQLGNAPYGGTCRRLCLDMDAPQTAWRICTEGAGKITICQSLQIDLHQTMPYFIVRTKSGRAAYQLVSVWEDVREGMTHIVRGADLIESTAAQLFLANQVPALQPFASVQFLHHPLWLDAHGEKLSKSKGAASVRAWRQEHRHPEAFYRLFAHRMGLPAVTSAAALLEVYTP